MLTAYDRGKCALHLKDECRIGVVVSSLTGPKRWDCLYEWKSDTSSDAL
jgi:hypothetical protein